MSRHVTRAGVLVGAFAAAVLTTGTAIWYARAMLDEGDRLTTPTPMFVLSSLLVVVLLLVGGSLSRPGPVGVLLLAVASGALLMLGLIGMWSIGSFLVLAAAFGVAATLSARRASQVPWTRTAVAGLAAIAIVLGSFVSVASID